MGTILYQCLMSLCASLCFGVIFQVRGVKLAFAGLGGLLSWLIFVLCRIPFPVNDIPRYFFATIAVTVFSEWCARAFRAPVTLFLAVSLIPLVPGNGIYQTMLLAIRGDTGAAASRCIHTVGIAGALSVGILLVSSSVHLFLTRHERK